MSKGQFLIIDAHAMAFRAYYAFQGQNLTNPATGLPTGAIFGFFRMLFKVVGDYRPDHVAVTWDPSGPTFRSDIFPDYKATRKPMPEDLRGQIDEIKELCVKCGFRNLEEKGFEADDLMGSLAKRFGKTEKVILLTGDKDCYQLLDKNVKMLRGKKGVTEFVEIDPTWVKTEVGVTPAQITDYMGLVGDSSDNIPGAKGVGPKSAATLIQDYKNLEGVYKNIGKLKGKALVRNLEEAKDKVFLSRDLATIDTEMKVVAKLKLEEFVTPDYLRTEVLSTFRQGGYNALYVDLKKQADARSSGAAPGAKAKAKSKAKGKAKNKAAGEEEAESAAPVGKSGGKYELIDTLPALKKLITTLSKASVLSVDTETTSPLPMDATLVGVSLSDKKGRAWYIAVPPEGSPHADKGIPLDEARPLLQKLLGDKKIKKVGQNIKYDLLVLRRHGIELAGIHFDTMIASYLTNPNVRRHNMDDMALDLLAYETIKYSDVVGTGKKAVTMDQLDPAHIRDYACEDADITFQLFKELGPMLKKRDLVKVNDDIEITLMPVLADMEMAGVAIDEKYFAKLSKDYNKKLTSLEKKIHDAAGYEFNINSTKELQKVLFEDLRLPTGKKTKTGYSTDQSVLEELRGLHSVVDWLLDHRKYGKLKSTYVEALPAQVNAATGRIHTSFNQTIAATGRLSSVDPNLQNIPIREETGRAIRRGFIPRKGNVMLSLDYSQIELRIMAHVSEDEHLIEAFTKDKIDVHARTAASLFDVSEKDVTPDQRSQAKVLNFAIIYGVTEWGLSQNLSISREESRDYIQRFFERYPGVRKYMDDTIAFAEKKGYVETLSGRKRQIPEIKSTNRFRREGAQRTAINTPVQGTSADIIKMAMIQIHADMTKKKLESKMILQVHDELLFDCVPAEKDEVLKIAKGRMEKAMKLKVPLKVEHGFGGNWDEAH